LKNALVLSVPFVVDGFCMMGSMSRRVARITGLLVALSLIVLVRPASAQWYIAGFMGLNETFPADVRVDRGPGTSLTFHKVEFEAKPMSAPPYFGGRFGRLFGKDRRIGVEFEFLHSKVIARTNAVYQVTGTANNIAIDQALPMNTLVERFQMTHGLNYFLGNVVARLPLGEGRFTFGARGGGGVTRPHAETTIGRVVQEQYEWAGLGAQGAAGLDGRLFGKLSAFGEYKVTYAKPEITLAGGTGQMTAIGQQFTFGLAFGWAR